MNAIGIASGGASAATPAGAATAVSGAGAAAGKAGAAGGFIGALVQAMEGGASTSASASGTGISAGLAGLLSLLGGQGNETPPELTDLLAGLNEQLGSLDSNAKLPDDLQNQLAGLLLLVQNLLAVPLANAQAAAAFEAAPGSSGGGMSDPDGASAQTGAQTLIAALRQALAGLSDRLSADETLKMQAAGLAAPFQQAMTALQVYSGQPAAVRKAEQRSGSDAGKPVQASANVPFQGVSSVSADSSSASKAAVQTDIRSSAAPFRNPVWTYLTQPAATEAAPAQDGQAPVTAAQPADAEQPNGSVPAWTFIKSDANVIPAAGTANAPALPSVPVHQFAEQMGKFLVKQFSLSQGNGVTEAKISLHPEHLGQVDIKIQIQNGQLTAHFVAENGTARDLLENQMSQLRAALQSQGLQVDKMEVSQQSSQTDAAAFFQQQQGRQGSGHQGGGSRGRNAGGSYEDASEFEAELDRTAYLREIGYGASLNVTA